MKYNSYFSKNQSENRSLTITRKSFKSIGYNVNVSKTSEIKTIIMVLVVNIFKLMVFLDTVCSLGEQTTTTTATTTKTEYYYDDYYDYDYGPPPDFYDLHGPDCATKHSCKSTSSYDCYCDARCDVFKDCCHDANLTNSHPASAKLKEVFPYTSCEYFPEVYRLWFIFVVNSCPLDSDETLKDLCQNIDRNNIVRTTPVVGKLTYLLYRNVHCAVCNNDTYTFLNPDLVCSWQSQYHGNYSIEELLKLDECEINYRFKGDDMLKYEVIRRCYPAITECTNSTVNDTLAKGCEKGRNEYVFTEHNIYTNKDCFFCGTESEYNASCNMGDIYNTSMLSAGYKSPSPYSYRMLFDLESGNVKSQKRGGFGGRQSKEFSIGGSCRDTQIFDPFANSCRDILCTDGFTMDGVSCLHANTSLLQNDSCSVIQFTRDEYNILNETSIFIYASNKTYTDVTFLDGLAYVCFNIRGSVLSSRRNDPIEGWLSFVCGIVSTVCLLVTILVYMIPKMLNQPGRILLCLSISLFLAQVIFLLAPNAETNHFLCQTVGILDHFLFLASFFWMNVMSFDVFKTFSSSFCNVENNRKHFVYYSLYAWLTSLVVVGIGVSMDEMKSWSYRPKYGEGACWITSNKGLILFMLIPVAILMLFNSIFFSLSVRSICVTKRQSSKTLQTRSNCEVFIYIKLSIVMGLTWTFGYIATLIRNNIFWYLFIIFNGSQGLFIFCSFVLKKNVYRAVRQCLQFEIHKTKQTMQTPSSQLTMESTVIWGYPFRHHTLFAKGTIVSLEYFHILVVFLFYMYLYSEICINILDEQF